MQSHLRGARVQGLCAEQLIGIDHRLCDGALCVDRDRSRAVRRGCANINLVDPADKHGEQRDLSLSWALGRIPGFS